MSNMGIPQNKPFRKKVMKELKYYYDNNNKMKSLMMVNKKVEY